MSCSDRALARLALGIALALASLHAGPARANCNVIPHVSYERHRGAVGTVNRPYSSPGDPVELAAAPSCGFDSFSEVGVTNGKLEDEYRVLLAYEPPEFGPKRVVVLSESCTGVEPFPACVLANVESAHCLEVDNTGPTPVMSTKNVSGELRLEFRLPPGTCDQGEPVVCYRDADCASGAAGSCKLPGLPERTLTGPLTIAAYRTSLTTPCQPISGTCASIGTVSGMGACVDALYWDRGDCDVANADVDPTFPSFTALPPPNDFAQLCDPNDPYAPACTLDPQGRLRFAVDERGNILVPMLWTNALPATQGMTRFVAGSSAFPTRKGGKRPIRLVDLEGLAAFTKDGVRLPAFLQARRGNKRTELMLFGEVEAQESVVRIGRRPRPRQGHLVCSDDFEAVCSDEEPCVTGAACETKTRCLQSGPAPCTDDGDCTYPNACGLAAHDASSRMKGGVGPIEVERVSAPRGVCDGGGTNDGKACKTDAECSGATCVGYRAHALWSAMRHYSTVTNKLLVTVVDEAVVDKDLDDVPGKTSEHVVLVADRQTLKEYWIGASGATRGVASLAQTVSVGGNSFAFPVVLARGNVVALVENCAAHPAQCGASTTPRLRVYRLQGSVFSEVTSAASPIPALEDDAIDGLPIAIGEGGRIFYRAEHLGTPHLFRLNATGANPAPVAMCAATAASVSGDRVALLVPEAKGSCNDAQPLDLNGDGDTLDVVVNRWSKGGGPIDNLHCAATRVQLRDEWLAATVAGGDNGEQDGGNAIDDEVLMFHRAADQSTECNGNVGKWIDTMRTADLDFALSGDAVAFATPGTREMHVAYASPLLIEDLPRTTDRFALGDRVERCGGKQVLAFGADVGGVRKAQLYDLVGKQSIAVGTSVRPCDAMVCDPRRPYAVDGNIVRVLSKRPVTGDEIEVFDVCRGDPSGSFMSFARAPELEFEAFREQRGLVKLGGVCSQKLGAACSDDRGCAGGAVCLALDDTGKERGCFAEGGWCKDDADCASTERCRLDALSIAYEGDQDGDGLLDSKDPNPLVPSDASPPVIRDDRDPKAPKERDKDRVKP